MVMDELKFRLQTNKDFSELQALPEHDNINRSIVTGSYKYNSLWYIQGQLDW